MKSGSAARKEFAGPNFDSPVADVAAFRIFVVRCSKSHGAVVKCFCLLGVGIFALCLIVSPLILATRTTVAMDLYH